MTNTPDIGLVEMLPLEKRLRLEYPVGKVDPVDGTADAWAYRNPDGPEAADRIERLAAEGVKMRSALEGLIGAVEQHCNEPGGGGISGCLSARLSDARQALSPEGASK